MHKLSWKPEDYIVAALAILIIVLLLFRMYGVVLLNVPVTADAARVVEGLLNGVMAIISMYIGAKIQKHRDKD